MFWNYLKYAHTHFCQYHTIVCFHCHFAGCCLCRDTDTDPFKGATILFSHAMSPHHIMELFGLDHITSNRYHSFGWNSVAFRSLNLLGHWVQLWLLCILIQRTLPVVHLKYQLFFPSYYHCLHYTLLITLPKHQSLFYRIQEGLYQLESWQKTNYIRKMHNLKRIK